MDFCLSRYLSESWMRGWAEIGPEVIDNPRPVGDRAKALPDQRRSSFPDETRCGHERRGREGVPSERLQCFEILYPARGRNSQRSRAHL